MRVALRGNGLRRRVQAAACGIVGRAEVSRGGVLCRSPITAGWNRAQLWVCGCTTAAREGRPASPVAQGVAKLLQQARLQWWGLMQQCTNVAAHTALQNHGTKCTAVHHETATPSAPAAACAHAISRPEPPTFFSSSWQSLTCDSIHSRVKVWLCALCGRARGVEQGDRACTPAGLTKGGGGWLLAARQWQPSSRVQHRHKFLVSQVPPAPHSHAPVGGPQVHCRKVDHGQVVVGRKVLARLGGPVCGEAAQGEGPQQVAACVVCFKAQRVRLLAAHLQEVQCPPSTSSQMQGGSCVDAARPPELEAPGLTSLKASRSPQKPGTGRSRDEQAMRQSWCLPGLCTCGRTPGWLSLVRAAAPLPCAAHIMWH